jgi:hypothetical protein
LTIYFNIDALIHALQERGVNDPAMKDLVEDLRCVLVENQRENAQMTAEKSAGFMEAALHKEKIVLLKRKVRKLQHELRLKSSPAPRSSARRRASSARTRRP